MARTYTYTCSYCGESFSSPRELGRHEKRYEGQCEDFAQRSIAQRTELWQCATDNRQAAAAQPQAVVDSIRDQDIETASNFHCELDVEQLISDPQVPATVFDSTYQLFTFVKQWGLSASQQQELLNLLHNPDFRQSEVPSKAAELQQYSHRLLDHLAPAEKSGWERVTRLNVKNWPEEVVLRHRDGVKYLKEVLGRADILASLHLVGELRLNSAGQRVWLLFWEADAFLEEQQHVRSKHGADAKVCALQFYSDKTQVNDTTDVYPFKVGLLNLERAAKIKHLGTLALIPILKHGAHPELSKEQLRDARRDLMRQCTSTVLKELKEASHTGLHITLANGDSHWIFPRALNYVADDPEQHAVLQIKSGVRTLRQCCRCYITTNQLSDVHIAATNRSLERQLKIFDLMEEAHQRKQRSSNTAEPQPAGDLTDVATISRQYGTHFDKCGLWGFAGEENDSCDPYQIFSFDFMHNWSLGVLQNIIRGMAAYADRVQQPGSSRHGTRALKALDQRLQQVPRVEGLTLPSTQQYFSDPAKITSTEHMAVQQVLPLLVHGLVDDELTKLVCCACELAMRIYTRNRPAGFTQAGLDAIDAEIVKLRDTLSRLYAADATGTPKFHKLAHLTTDIKRNGHPENYNSDLYEADHCPLKEIYRLSSKRTRGGRYLDEIMSGLQMRELLRKLAPLAGNGEAQHYMTAYMAAAASSSSQLCSTYVTVDLQILAEGEAAAEGRLNRSMVQRSMQLRAADQQQAGLLAQLAVRLQEFYLGDVQNLGYGREYQQVVARDGLPSLCSSVIRVHNNAVLAAEAAWSEDSFILQAVRATDEFHGSPWYDCVSAHMHSSKGTSLDADLEYAQLVLLFQAQVPNPDAGCEWVSLAYVKWFAKAARRGDVLSRYQAYPLAWDRRADGAHKCSIIPLESIRSRMHIVPRFEPGMATASDGFYLNPFKY